MTINQENILKCHSTSVIFLNSLGSMVTWTTPSINIIDIIRPMTTGTQIEKVRLSVIRMVPCATQTWNNPNSWLFNQIIFQRDVTEKLESIKLVLPLKVRMLASTISFQSWKFAQTMFSRDLERRESGILELRPLITKLTREPCKSVIITRVDL